MSNSLLEILTKSAAMYPEKTAVRCSNREISYQEINLLSERLCFCLINEGVKEGDRIGIYMDKTIDFIVSIFGILKAGGCYVPLDPMTPTERQSYIIADSLLEYLVITSQKLSRLYELLKNNNTLKRIFVIDIYKQEYRGSYVGVKMIFKDEMLESQRNRSAPKIDDDNLAYILYTSGSTGKPKGIMISHGASLAFINWAYKYFAITSDERMSAVSPFHFDLSIFDIFVTIKAGSTLCIVPQGMCGFPLSLAEFIESEKISTWYSVPSILIQIVLYGELKKRDLSALRRVIFAGEVFPIKYLSELMQLIPSAYFYNLYGPTETNVCTFYPATNTSEFDQTVPIGKPCEGIEVFVVDEAGNLVKEGEIGELYVRGPTLMQGYWNNIQKTDEVLLKFFLPFLKNKNVYKTGDLVKVNKNGDLEFHGRKDDMIKSRGYRIELGEIESVLYEHPSVKEVVVIAIPDDKIGNKIKVAIVLKEGYSLTEKDVRSFCSKRLPLYMVPEIISFNNFIPKTSTRKVDREELKIIRE